MVHGINSIQINTYCASTHQLRVALPLLRNTCGPGLTHGPKRDWAVMTETLNWLQIGNRSVVETLMASAPPLSLPPLFPGCFRIPPPLLLPLLQFKRDERVPASKVHHKVSITAWHLTHRWAMCKVG